MSETALRPRRAAPSARPTPSVRLEARPLGCLLASLLVATFSGCGKQPPPAGTESVPTAAVDAEYAATTGMVTAAFAEMEPLIAGACAGDSRSQAGLGVAFLVGSNVTPSEDMALKWLGRCADAEPEARFRMGLIHRDSETTNRNPVLAMQHIRTAADDGHAPAQYACALLLSEDAGDAARMAEAAAYFEKAAEQGHVAAQRYAGECSFFGYGVATNQARAVHWWRRAADAGDLDSMVSLACCYTDGAGVPLDLGLATAMLLVAAGEGHAEAQFRLGCRYHDGTGVAPDYRRSAEWLGMAADQGYADATQALNVVYAEAMDAAFETFSKRGLPQFRSNPDLSSVADATADMKSRLKFPTIGECDDLMAACNRILDGGASNGLDLATFGSLVLLDYEQDMQRRGYRRYGGAFLDSAGAAQLNARLAQRREQIEAYRRTQGLRIDAAQKEAALRRASGSAPRHGESRFFSTDESRVRLLGGGTVSRAQQHRNYLARLEREAREAREALTGGGGMSVQVLPPGTSGYQDYMRSTHGGRVGTTANAGEFGELINPGGSNR